MKTTVTKIAALATQAARKGFQITEHGSVEEEHSSGRTYTLELGSEMTLAEALAKLAEAMEEGSSFGEEITGFEISFSTSRGTLTTLSMTEE